MSGDMPSGRAEGGASTTEDRILYWPVATAVACALAVVLAWANLFFGSLLLVPIVLLFWAGMGVRAAIMSVAWWRARAWRRFYSAVILPVTALAMVLCFAPLWSVGRMAGNYVHLIALYPRYKAEISELTGDAPRFLIWEWTGSEFCSSGVAYDDRDELEPRWVTDERIGTVEVEYVSRAFGHFYFVLTC
jgi:hypothetical protein